jgi:hypothetical protein
VARHCGYTVAQVKTKKINQKFNISIPPSLTKNNDNPT